MKTTASEISKHVENLTEALEFAKQIECELPNRREVVETWARLEVGVLAIEFNDGEVSNINLSDALEEIRTLQQDELDPSLSAEQIKNGWAEFLETAAAEIRKSARDSVQKNNHL